jgi:DNA (cytosine-5)-methyltransferase 1
MSGSSRPSGRRGKSSRPRVGSLFAGIGGFDKAFEDEGFEVAWCVEWDRQAQAVLRKRFPHAEIYGDITQVSEKELLKKHGKVEVICGGFPCQDLSVAGHRKGLQGERSGLFFEAMRIVRGLKPQFALIENVHGLLTSNRGHDFATLLREMGEGWPCAEVGWRLLDSQFFDVPQRRERVFIVGSARVGGAAEVLALADRCEGDPLPSRETRKEAARGVRGFTPSQFANYRQGVGTLRANGGDLGGGSETLVVEPRKVTLKGGKQATMPVVRKLTPVECERMHGFPDGWTAVDDAKDGVRYKQLGNAVTVNVARWIAARMARCVTCG